MTGYAMKPFTQTIKASKLVATLKPPADLGRSDRHHTYYFVDGNTIFLVSISLVRPYPQSLSKITKTISSTYVSQTSSKPTVDPAFSAKFTPPPSKDGKDEGSNDDNPADQFGASVRSGIWVTSTQIVPQVNVLGRD